MNNKLLVVSMSCFYPLIFCLRIFTNAKLVGSGRRFKISFACTKSSAKLLLLQFPYVIIGFFKYGKKACRVFFP